MDFVIELNCAFDYSINVATVLFSRCKQEDHIQVNTSKISR